MDGKRIKLDSILMINQCARRLHDGVDRISALPDEIIVAILSFLSLREAATTSVLSSRWLDLWKHTPNLKSDRISQLPDSIIVDILSLLPWMEAVATSVLSSRWPDLWKHTTNLDFNVYKLKLDSYARYEMDLLRMNRRSWDAERCKYIQLVNCVINSHKAPHLKQFAISFYVNQSAECIVAKWLKFAFSREVETLELDFWCDNQRYMVVLEELLSASGLWSSPQRVICFKPLKRLSLKRVMVSGEAVKISLCNCPLLEELIIGKSILTSDVEVCGATLMLKNLEVYCCSGEKSLRVSAPNLTRLKFCTGIKFCSELGNTKLFLGSVPKLVEARFEIDSQRLDVLQNVASALFHLSSQLEILDLRPPKEFLANEFREMPKLRKLVVELFAPKRQSLLPVTSLLWASPRLQEFKLKCWNTQRNVDVAIQVRRNGESPHLHLKLFELKGLIDGSDGHIEMVNYISDNCVGLEKIKIFFGSPFESKEAARDYAQQRLEGKLPQHILLQLI